MLSKIRGQAAIEYLSSYAWAIIVVSLVGVILFESGFFSLRPAAVTYIGFIGLEPMPTLTQAVAGGPLEIIFVNAKGVRVIINSAQAKLLDSPVPNSQPEVSMTCSPSVIGNGKFTKCVTDANIFEEIPINEFVHVQVKVDATEQIMGSDIMRDVEHNGEMKLWTDLGNPLPYGI